MIRTAMVGRQPTENGEEVYRFRGKQLQFPTSNGLTLEESGFTLAYHLTTINGILARCIQEQVIAGIDILSEGECFRDDYWSYLLYNLDGIKVEGPQLYRQWDLFSELKLKHHFLADDWYQAQEFTTRPVKITIPGPLTVATYVSENLVNGRKLSTKDFENLVAQLVPLINGEVLDASLKGCKHIQIDDPQLAYQPGLAKEFGIASMSACFDGVNSDVNRFLHVCRGYSSSKGYGNSMDGLNEGKAAADCYIEIMPLLDKAAIDVISIENAYHPNSPALFEMIENKTLMLGSTQINSDRVETPQEIVKVVENVLQLIPQQRLILAPDCGCLCNKKSFLQKMTNISKAAKMFS